MHNKDICFVAKLWSLVKLYGKFISHVICQVLAGLLTQSFAMMLTTAINKPCAFDLWYHKSLSTFRQVQWESLH